MMMVMMIMMMMIMMMMMTMMYTYAFDGEDSNLPVLSTITIDWI
jgi:hypothetical protein